MQPRIAHQPTDRNKARWKAYALFALIGFWLCSGIVGRDPWKPDEPVYIGILQSLLDAVGSPGGAGGSAWRAMVAGQPVDGEITLIHWINAPLAALLRAVMPLHEAARVTSVLWAALGIASLFAAARRWSGGHISFLAAIIAIGCVGLYDRAHTYVPDIAVFAASALALYGCAALAEAPRRATLAFVGAIVLAFAARSVLGYAVVATPMLLLAWAPVYSMHRVALVRVDQGDWVEARLGDAYSIDTWRQWVYEWDATPGDHELQVRATDGNGDVQTADQALPAPDGATGHHTVVVSVS